MRLRDVLPLAREAWRDRWLQLGPVLITTREKEKRMMRGAFELGCDHGATYGPALRPAPVRHLHTVS